MTDKLEYKERGYLKDSFQIFYLTEHLPDEVLFHYHEFLKIFILLRGNLSYAVEGNEYELHPYDIVLINAGELHRPIAHDQNGYERIIIVFYSHTHQNKKYIHERTNIYAKKNCTYDRRHRNA